jgi:hypothetical protein
MSLKLNKAKLEQRDDLAKRLGEAFAQIESEIASYRDELEKLRGPIEGSIEAYNAILAEAREFAEDIVTDASSAIEDKSEKWQEGERGQAAIAFRDAWEGLSLEDLELEWPDDVELEDPGHADEIYQALEEAI